jgi:hypothetical protein
VQSTSSGEEETMLALSLAIPGIIVAILVILLIIYLVRRV